MAASWLVVVALIPGCGESTDPNREPLLEGIVAVEAQEATSGMDNAIEKVDDRIVHIGYHTGACSHDAVPTYPESVSADYAPDLIVVRVNTTITCRGGNIDDIAYSSEMLAELTEPIGDRKLRLVVAAGS